MPFPHIAKLMLNRLAAVLEHTQLIVIGNNDPAFKTIFTQIKPDQTVIVLLRIDSNLTSSDNYEGISW
jgi:hypothetical protein